MNGPGQFLHFNFGQIEKLHFRWDTYVGKILISKFLGEISGKMVQNISKCSKILKNIPKYSEQFKTFRKIPKHLGKFQNN